MKRFLFAAALLACSSASIAELSLPTEGWSSWEVEAIDRAPNWCCLQWQRKPVTRSSCDLDGSNNGYGSTSEEDTVRTMRVYARFAGSKLEKIRSLGPQCEVTAQTTIRDLGKISSEESARWISAQVQSSSKRIVDDALAALSVHRGSAPRLIALATSDANPKVRSQAWFWLSQARAPETERAIAASLKQETDRKVRHEAIFALSQLPSERAAKALSAVVEDRSLPREDRKQAIFWMGQVDSPHATAYLDRLLGGE